MISLVGSSGAVSATSPVVVSRTTTTGSLLVALCSRTSATDYFTGVTDSAGNVWILAAAAPTSGAVGRRVEIWYCANANSITTLSAAFAGSVPGAVTLHEFSGAVTASPLDTAFAKFQSSVATPSAATVTPTEADEFVIGMIRANTGGAQTYTLTSPGWTAINVPIAEHHAIAYYNGPPAGVALGPTWTLGSAAGSGSATAAFKAAAVIPAMGDVKVWNGTSWVDANTTAPIKYWNGTSWVAPSSNHVKVWNGSSWVSVR